MTDRPASSEQSVALVTDVISPSPNRAVTSSSEGIEENNIPETSDAAGANGNISCHLRW